MLSYPYFKAGTKYQGFVHDETIAPVVAAGGLFASRERTADATAFADGVTSIFATGLDISLAGLREYGGN